MASVCEKHVKTILNQFTVPHVKRSTIETTCQYCGERAVYTFYYDDRGSTIKHINKSTGKLSAC